MTENGISRQVALQRRLRAARALQDVSLKELASRLDPAWKLSERTLRKLETGENEITERALVPIAEALGVPIGWLTAEDPLAPFRGTPEPALVEQFEQRLRELEARVGVTGPPVARRR